VGNVRKEAEFINSNRFAMSFRGIEISDCPYIQNTTLLDILKACPTLFDGNMTLSRRCSSSSYLAGNTKPSVINSFTLDGSTEHTVDNHEKLLAWLSNTIRGNSCHQIARIAIDTASKRPRKVPLQRWEIVPPKSGIAKLVNTSRKMLISAEENDLKERVFSITVACTAAGLYRVLVSVSNQMLQGPCVQRQPVQRSGAWVFAAFYRGRDIQTNRRVKKDELRCHEQRIACAREEQSKNEARYGGQVVGKHVE